MSDGSMEWVPCASIARFLCTPSATGPDLGPLPDMGRLRRGTRLASTPAVRSRVGGLTLLIPVANIENSRNIRCIPGHFLPMVKGLRSRRKGRGMEQQEAQFLLGRRIKALRRRRELTQEVLAE